MSAKEFKIKCLTTGNESTMFDADGLPVAVEVGDSIKLKIGFFQTANSPLNLIYLSGKRADGGATGTWDWLDSKNPSPDSRPDNSAVFGTLEVSRNGSKIFSKNLTFGDGGEAYITVSSFASGTVHAVAEIPASVFAKSGVYTFKVASLTRQVGSLLYNSRTWKYDFNGFYADNPLGDVSLGTVAVAGDNSDEPSGATGAIAQRLRVALDCQSYETDAINTITNDLLKLHAGNSAKLQIGLFRGGEIPSDLLGESPSLELVIKDTGGDWYPDAEGGVVVKKTFGTLNTQLTKDSWNGGTACHAEILLTPEDTALTAGVRWLCVNLVLGEDVITFYAGRIYILDNGVSGASLVEALDEIRRVRQEALDARDQILALVNEQTNPTALYERIIKQLNSALVATGNRIFIGEDRGLYMRDETEGGDGLYHKLELVRVDGQLMLAPSENGVENV